MPYLRKRKLFRGRLSSLRKRRPKFYRRNLFKRRRYRPRRYKKRNYIKTIVKRVMAKKVETMHLDHKYVGSQGATYSILPWGVDSDLLKGTVCGDVLPVNQLNNIHQLNPGPVPPGDSVRQGNSIYLKSIKYQLRLRAPVWNPILSTPITATSVNYQGPGMHAKVRLLVVYDTEGEQSLDPASTNSGVLNDIYDDLAFPTGTKRQLPTFKSYRSNKRFKVLSTKILTLDGSKKPFYDIDFSVKVNKKITYIPGTDACQQGIYLFAMSDYPITASIDIHVMDPPKVENFWARYYYTDS